MKRANNILLIVSLIAVFLCGCNSGEVSPVENTEAIIESMSSSSEGESTEPAAVIMEEMAVVETAPVETEPVIEETEPPFKEYEYFCEDVYYDAEYIDSGEYIPHFLFTPSTANDYEKIPLILWLHGSGEKNSDITEHQWSGLNKVMTAWDFMHLEGMNAYVVAPHLVQGDFWSPYWCSEDSANNIQDLLDYYIENYNVDPAQIAVSGHSLGGQGAVYMPQVLPETFCAMAPISVYNPCIPITNFDIPVWCFEGQKGKGEDSASIEYAFDKFARAYGEDRITTLPVGHGALPMAVFSMDNDGNLRTDLFEWLAEQMSASALKASLAESSEAEADVVADTDAATTELT